MRKLYERVERRRRSLTNVERAAIDRPALFSIHFVTQRRAYFAPYVERRQAAGHLRDDVDPVVAASLVPSAPRPQRRRT